MTHHPVALLLLPLAGLFSHALHAAPYVPRSDDEVVQHLPTRLSAGERQQRQQLARVPQNLPLALATARAAIERARALGDPRELGVAQAALGPWWNAASPPPAALLLRATVRQSQHQFDAALRDLDALISPPAAAAAVPTEVRAQALLTRATVRQVTGQWAAAEADCSDLRNPPFDAMGAPLATAAQACLAELRSLRGQAPASARELAQLARQAPQDGWLALVQAELAERLGDHPSAALHYRDALAHRSDVYTQAAAADWLLGQRRAAEALALLNRPTDSGPGLKRNNNTDDEATHLDTDADALLLRRAIAHQQLRHAPEARAAAATMQARFAAARLRGENFHAREEARLALDVLGDTPAALKLAQANWAHQKEPADALLLLRAAVAAGQPHAAVEVQALRAAGWQDARLAAAERAEVQP